MRYLAAAFLAIVLAVPSYSAGVHLEWDGVAPVKLSVEHQDSLNQYQYVVDIYSETREGIPFSFSGTAVYVGDNTFFTARHIFSHVDGLKYGMLIADVAVDISEVKLHETMDFAMFTVVEWDTSDAVAAKYSLEKPEYLGTAICGGLGSKFQLHLGHVTSPGIISLPVADTGIIPGDSGSGVWMDDTLVGIISGYHTENNRVAIFVPLYYVKDLLEPVKEEQPVEDPAPEPKAAMKVFVFTADWCGPCQKFKKDNSAGKFKGQFEFEYVTWDDSKHAWDHPDIEKRFRDATGYKQQIQMPLFWVEGTNKYDIGYSSPETLKKELLD